MSFSSERAIRIPSWLPCLIVMFGLQFQCFSAVGISAVGTSSLVANFDVDSDKDETQQLIIQLASGNFAKREQAMQRLIELGDVACGEVIEQIAALKTDTETRTRCIKIVDAWIANADLQTVIAIEKAVGRVDQATLPERLVHVFGDISHLNRQQLVNMLRESGAKAISNDGVLMVQVGASVDLNKRSLRVLANLKSPFELMFLKGAEIRIADLQRLRVSEFLQKVTIQTKAVTPQVFEELTRLKSLKSLYFTNPMELPSETIASLSNLTQLESLVLSTYKLDPSSICKAIGKLENLKEIKFLYGYNITVEHAQHFSRLKNLKKFNLESTHLTDRDATKLPVISSVQNVVGNQVYQGDLIVEWLAKLPKLNRVHLANSRLTDDGVEEISKLKNIRSLDIKSTVVTDQSIPHLASMENLEVLNVGGTFLSKAGVKELRDKLPKTKIIANSVDPKTEECRTAAAKLSRLGVRVCHSNASISIFINEQSWSGSSDDLLLTNSLGEIRHFGINVPVDIEMAEILLEVKPAKIHVSEKDFSGVSEPLRKKLEKHHQSIVVFK